MLKPELYQKIYVILRVAVAMCFIGHGSFGLITKTVWCNYFALFGIGHNLSYQLMPVVGCIDITLGILMLLYPMRIIPAWLVIWGVFTALLRPLSGEPFGEFIERSGNFGAPLALLIMCGGSKNIKGWFTRIELAMQPGVMTYKNLRDCLQIIGFLLLLGHGWLNLVEKKALVQQYALFGFSDAIRAAQIIGWGEIVLAFMILIKPVQPVLLAAIIWKMGSELFYPHYVVLEWVERAGSYGVLIALWMVISKKMLVFTVTAGKAFIAPALKFYRPGQAE